MNGEWYPSAFNPQELPRAVETVKNFPGLQVTYKPDKGGQWASLDAFVGRKFYLGFYLWFKPKNEFSSINFEAGSADSGTGWHKDLFYYPPEPEGHGVPPTFTDYLRASLAEQGPSRLTATRSTLSDFMSELQKRYRRWERDYFPRLEHYYETFVKALYPPLEHWKLHTGEEEYAEAIQADDALLRRLRLGN